MSCDGLQSINPVCRGKEVIAQSTDTAFTQMSHNFGQAAEGATTWLWDQIGVATTVDLSHLGESKPLAATAAVGTVLCLGLFLLQVITAALRQEPGGLLRSLKGLFISLMGTGFALGTTVLLLAAVDSASAGLVQYTMGTNLRGLGNRLTVAHLATVTNPAAALLFAVVILAAVVVVWAALMIRKMMILIAAVLAPLAFAGASADITRGWVRRWVEFVAAMIASKLLLVIIFSIGVSVLDGYGQSSSGVSQTTTQLAAGTLILLLGGFAPWAAVKTFHFAGDSLYAAHAAAATGGAGAHAVIAAPQKAAAMQWQARVLSGGSRPAGAHRPPPPTPDPQRLGSPPPPSAGPGSTGAPPPPQPGVGPGAGSGALTTGGVAASRAAGGGAAAASTGAGASSAGAGASSAGAGAASAGAAGAAAAPIAIPAVLAAGTVAMAKGTATATGNALSKAGSQTSSSTVAPGPASSPTGTASAPPARSGGSAGPSPPPRPARPASPGAGPTPPPPHPPPKRS